MCQRDQDGPQRVRAFDVSQMFGRPILLIGRTVRQSHPPQTTGSRPFAGRDQCRAHPGNILAQPAQPRDILPRVSIATVVGVAKVQLGLGHFARRWIWSNQKSAR